MPIFSIPSLTIMSAQSDMSYVAVISVENKTSARAGSYKRVLVSEELGRWSSSYYFNLFDNMEAFNFVKPGMKLKIEVTLYLSNHKFIIHDILTLLFL